MKILTRSLTGTTLALLMALAPAHVSAQAPQGGAGGGPNMPDQAELETFAEAYVAIGEVRAEMSPELAAAENAEEANALQQEANDRMTQILDEHGLSVERYSAITQILNSDEELRAEFEAVYEELTGADGSGNL
ncbi:MAG: DUF4168 domain-containing protein [Gemmatimonadota bacterium]|nr:DUF4168 domain-containing protein [Gemmatimonadota bacterium]